MPSLGDLMVRVGAELDPSLNSTMDTASGKLSDFSDAAGNAGESWAQASGKIADAIPGIQNLGNQSEDASKSVGDLVEQLLALGEALAIADALKDFAGDALTLYTNVEKASVSLTALTGSVGTANQTIEGLKDLALNDALSFPELLQAAQKMTALGFSTGQVNTILQTAGDTAAATGGDVGGIADAIDRMVLSGNVGARQLATLGISAAGLGEAMDVTEKNVTEAFKALDQTDRISALNDALGKFSGVAAAAATTVAGQWQILKTQWEEIMEEIGAALAPLAKQIISFVSIEVVPFFQSMIDGFQQLSPNMQTLITVATAAVPVVAAVALGLAGMGAAFTALAGVGEVVGVLAAIGVAVAGIHFSGLDTAALNLYHAIADNFPNIPEMFSNISAAVDAVSGKFNDWLQKSTGQAPLLAANLGGVQDTLDRIVPSISKMSLGDWISAALNPSTMLKIIMGELADTIQYLGGNYSSMAGAVVTALGNVNAANDLFNHNMAAQAGAFTSSGVQLSAIAKAYQTLKDNLTDAQEKLGEVKTAYDNGQASLGQYAAAQKAVETAQLALNPNFETQKQALKDLDTATKDLNTSQSGLNELLKLIAPPVITLTTAQNNLAKANQSVQDAAAAYATAQQNLNAAIALGPGHANELAAAQDALKTAETAGKDAKTAYEQATKDVSTAQKDATQFAKDQATTDADYATMLNTLGKSALLSYGDAIANVSTAKSKYVDAVTNELTIQAQLDGLIAQGKQGTADYTTTQGALTAAHQQVAQALKDLNTAQTVANTSQATLSASTKELLTDQTALDGLYKDHLYSDTTDLQTAVDALTTARQNEITAANELIVAEGNLAVIKATATSNEQDLKTATDDAKTAREALTAATKAASDAEGVIVQQFGLSKTAADVLANSTVSLTEVFKDMGLKSADSLQALADAATKEYNLIASTGTTSANQLRDAQIKALQDQKAAYIANGTDLSTAQQQTLDTLLNQQSYFNQQHEDQWHTLYTNIDNQVMQLSNTLVQDLFEGKGSFGQTALKALEDIGAAVVNAFISPATKAIANFIAGSLSSLGSTLGGLVSGFTTLGSTAASTASTVSLTFFGAGGQAASATSGVMGALNAATSALSGIVSTVASIAGAVAGIVGDIETAHSNTLLDRIEHETARMAIYLGDSGDGSINGLMWRLAQDLEFGEMEKDLNIIAPDIDKLGAPFWQAALPAMTTLIQALQNGGLAVNVSGGSTNSSGSASSINSGVQAGTAEYLPGTPGTTSTVTVPLASTDVVASLNNYQKTLQEYIEGKATAAQVEAAQAQLDQLKTYTQDQENYTALLQKYLADPTAAGKLSLDAAKAALTAAGLTTETQTTPAGPPELVTTVGELVTANTALDNINNTLQYNVGLSPWFQTAFQNINNGIVACAGWLQGIAGILGVTDSEITSLTAAISGGLGTSPSGATGSGSTAGVTSGTTSTASVPLNKTLADMLNYWTDALSLRNIVDMVQTVPTVPSMLPAIGGYGNSWAASITPGGAQGLAPITFNFPNASIRSANDAKNLLNNAVNELRRRNRTL